MTGDSRIGVTIDFTIRGADPNHKLPPDAVCATCDRWIADHTREMFRSVEPSRGHNCSDRLPTSNVAAIHSLGGRRGRMSVIDSMTMSAPKSE